MLWYFIAFLLILQIDISEAFDCNGVNVVNFQSLDSYFFPTGWNPNETLQLSNTNQRCKWTVDVPTGYFAVAKFYRNDSSTATVSVKYQNQLTAELVLSNDTNPFYFTSPDFEISLNVDNDVIGFGFRIYWAKYTETKSDYINLNPGEPPSVFVATNNPIVLHAETNAYVTVFSTVDASDLHILRQSAVFDGENINYPYLGNFLQIYTSGKSLISTGNNLTIFTFFLYQEYQDILFMVQDESNIDNLNLDRYTGMNCANEQECQLILDAENGTAAIVTYGDDPEFIKIANFENNSTLGVYGNLINPDNCIVNFTYDEIVSNRFPQKFDSKVRQYFLDKGKMQLFLVRNPAAAKWSTLFDGRYGFVQSPNYKINTDQQDIDEVFYVPEDVGFLKITMDILDVDFAADTILEVSIYMNNNVIYDQTFSATNKIPDKSIIEYGDQVKIQYLTYGKKTTGFSLAFSSQFDGSWSSSGSSVETTTSISSDLCSTCFISFFIFFALLLI